jgi:methionyl-tRNA synthetase
VLYHGFITSGGQKMSKSLGNVISPFELVAKYGTDATRYLLLRHVHPFEDTDITWERLDEWYNANLVNGLGNLVSRVMKMSETYIENPVSVTEYLDDQKIYWDACNVPQALDLTWSFVGDLTSLSELDEYIASHEPFKLIKTEPEVAKEQIRLLVQKLHVIAMRLRPIVPDTAEKILEAIKTNKKPENLFPRID